MSDKYEGVTHVVQVTTIVEMSCEHCDAWTGGAERFAESVSHYIDGHGYRLLHVGTETGTNPDDGSAAPYTIAILGK